MGWILLAAVGIAGWRIWHSGHWVPQPVVAKAGGWGWWKAREGLRYLYHATLRNPGLGILWMGLAASVARLARRRPAEPLLLLATALAVSGLGFVLLSGGDWMENGRFIVPFVPLLVLLVVAGLERLPAAPGNWLAAAWLAAGLAGVVHTARLHSTGYPPAWPMDMEQWGSGEGLPFTERYNRVHLRDVVPLAALRGAVSEVFARKGTPVTVLSQQAGMMAYHLAVSHSGRFRFIDLVGLCTADFTGCPVTAGRGNGPGGLNMDLGYLFSDWERIHRVCGIPKPDIVYGLDEADGRLQAGLLRHGYRVHHCQAGLMPAPGPWFPGLEIGADGFVMVLEGG
jgi:hypothetical protein